jgi:hypothetical protein
LLFKTINLTKANQHQVHFTIQVDGKKKASTSIWVGSDGNVYARKDNLSIVKLINLECDA